MRDPWEKRPYDKCAKAPEYAIVYLPDYADSQAANHITPAAASRPAPTRTP